ncbi:MAG TPA: ATP-binding protein [Steroidobacteraceae bacterium]|jgi:signal transduction histidine kinase/ActR/RegA family two-component response regulator|nr:ATP-binding protein [Steroidobacteraceae bacterium]
MEYASDQPSGFTSPPMMSNAIFGDESISSRTHRMPDYQMENAALLRLLDACVNAPGTIPKVLVDLALTACHADSAVLGIFETEHLPVFRWIAVSGALSSFEGLTIPVSEAPESLVLECDSPQVLRYPQHDFPGLPNDPAIVEGLFAPFKVEARAVGTLWVASHSKDRHFDEECMRITGQLARFAGIAQRLHESNDALRRTEEALKEADRRKDAFLAVLAHELRNPLAPIRNAAHILGAAALRPSELKWAQSVIGRQVAQMSRLLDDLLDISRITQNRIHLKIEPVALRSVVESAVEAVRPLIEEKNHRLSLDVPPQAVTFRADPVRLTQVLTNLLTNAAKYTDPKGRIGLRAWIDDGELLFCVQDNGVGLAGDALRTLFQIFSQVEETRDRSDGGLGIGLALTKALVEMHGGSIEARSAGIGHGSEFEVRIPLLSSPCSPVTGTSEADLRPPSARIRTLVADDNEDAAESLATLLGLAGHDVRVATGGKAALILAQAFRPEVAVIDIGMPDIDGYAVARSLRQQPWSDHLALVALTGWGQDGDRERARAAGFDHHLTKPADPERLEALISDLTRKARD